MIDVEVTCLIVIIILTMFNCCIYYVDNKDAKDVKKRVIKLEDSMNDFMEIVDTKEGLHDKRLMELEKKVEVDSKYTLKLCHYTPQDLMFLCGKLDIRVIGDVTHESVETLNKKFNGSSCLVLCETPMEEE